MPSNIFIGKIYHDWERHCSKVLAGERKAEPLRAIAEKLQKLLGNGLNCLYCLQAQLVRCGSHRILRGPSHDPQCRTGYETC